MSRSRDLLILRMLVLVPALLLSMLYWDRPETLLTSDTLTSAELIWDLLHHAGAWSTFQHPHSPEFVPADVVFGIIQAATGGWRIAMAAWVFVMLAWMIAVGSAIAGDNARISATAAAPAFLSLMVPIMTAAAFYPAGAFFPWFLLLLPGQHGGTLLLALTGGLVARQAVKTGSQSSLFGLAAIAFAAQASDQLCLFSLLAPATAASLGSLIAGTISRPAAGRLIAAVWCGAATGGLITAPIERQFMPPPTLSYLATHARHFLADIGQYPLVIAACLCVCLILIFELWRRGPRATIGGFWPIFGGTTVLGGLAFTIMFYEDAWSFRYALPALWWTLIFATSGLSNLNAWHRKQTWTTAGATIGGLAILILAQGLHLPGLFTWTSPLSTCLRGEGLQSGLADYWIARKTSMGSDWAAQIQPIDAYGAARVWGNDWQWFTHDIHDQQRRPAYRFIVMDNLPVDRITAAYGPPDRTMSCGTSAVWIYNDSTKVFDNLARASSFMADIFAAAPTPSSQALSSSPGIVEASTR